MSAESELAFVAKLRDDASATAASVKRNLASVGGDTRADIRVAAKDEASRSLGMVERSLGRVSGAASHVGGLLAGLRGPAGIAGAALGGVAALGIRAGLQTAAGMETAKISFTTMLGSAQKAGSFLKDLSAFAAKTPFEFPELQTAASSLISAGINANKVIPIMTTLGDVTSGMGTGSEGVQRATVALQQMSAAGRITGEDLNQLRDAGIPVYDLLAKATGKSKAEVVKLAQAGKLGSKELGQMMNALETGKGLERFSGLMDKQSASLSGQWSTLKDTANMALAGMITPVLPMLKAGMGKVSSTIAAAGPAITHVVTELGYLFGAITSGDGAGAAEILDNIFGNSGKLIGPFTTAIDYAKGVVDDLSAVFTNSLAPAFTTLSSEAKVFLGPLALLRAGLGFAADHGEATRVVLVGLGSALLFGRTAMLGYTAVTKVAAGAQYAYSLATGRAASAEGLATRAKITGALQTVKSTAITIASAIRTGVVMAATAARTVAAWVIMGAQSMIQAARMAAAWVIAMGPVGWVIAAVVAIVALVITHWDQVRGATVAAWNAVVGAIVGAWNAITGFVTGAVSAVLGFFRSHWPLILGILTGPFGLAVGLIVKHWSAIRGAVSSGVSAVIGFVRGLPGKILGAIGDLGSRLWSWAWGAFTRLGAAEREGIAGVVRLVTGLPGKILGALGNLGSILFDAGKKIIQGLIDGISHMFGSVKDKLGDLTGKLTSWKGPPKRDATILREAGRLVIQGFVDGIDASFGKVKTALGKVNTLLARAASTGAIGKGAFVATSAALRADTARLLAVVKLRDGLATRLKAAQTRLADAIKARTDYAAGVADAARSYAAITTVTAEGDAKLTATDVVRNLRDRLAAIVAFRRNVEALKHSGLNATSLRQIIDAGIESGGQIASALAGGGASAVAQVNAVQHSINVAAAGLGSSAAATLYDAGVQAARGLVSGISAQGKALDAAATVLANRLASRVRAALGIHSPSRVFHGVGENVIRGLVGGIDGNVSTVHDALDRVSSAVRSYGSVNGGLALAPVSVSRSTGVVVTLRHEVAFEGASPAGVTARDVADVIARDPKSAAQIEAALAPARARASSTTLVASR